MTRYWHAFDCRGPCPGVGPGRTGVCINLALDRHEDDLLPPVPCPLCGQPMEFRLYWEATDGGYGSEADPGGPRSISEWTRLRLLRDRIEAHERLLHQRAGRLLAELGEGWHDAGPGLVVGALAVGPGFSVATTSTPGPIRPQAARVLRIYFRLPQLRRAAAALVGRMRQLADGARYVQDEELKVWHDDPDLDAPYRINIADVAHFVTIDRS